MTRYYPTPPIDIEAFENVIADWLELATGLPVAWSRQSQPQQPYPFAVLNKVSGPIPMSVTWEKQHETSFSRPEGQEIAITEAIPSRYTIACHIYVDMPDARDPILNAEHYMAMAQVSLQMPSILETFRAANIAVERIGGIQVLDQVIEDAYVHHAVMDVVFVGSFANTEYTGFADKAHITSTDPPVDWTVVTGD